MNKPASNLGKTVPMKAESVNFTNGMIVTADDLSAAMTYPVALMQLVNRAVFGCGVVCGFELRPDPDLCGKTKPCDSCSDDSTVMAYPSLTVEIGRGTALDCSGLPVELCKPVRFDVGDEQCGCNPLEGKVCIFIRRVSSAEAPRGDCCGPTAGSVQCSRLQDHVQIRAFPADEGPEHACMHPFDSPGGKDEGCGNAEVDTQREKRWREHKEVCDCLTTCKDSDCCGEGWILIGCLELCKGGIVAESFGKLREDGSEAVLFDQPPYSNRKWIKTIECSCREVEVKKLEDSAYRVQQAEALALTDATPDPDIENKLKAIVENDSRVAILKLLGILNLEHFRWILKNKQELLKQACGLSTNEKLDEWDEKAEAAQQEAWKA